MEPSNGPSTRAGATLSTPTFEISVSRIQPRPTAPQVSTSLPVMPSSAVQPGEGRTTFNARRAASRARGDAIRAMRVMRLGHTQAERIAQSSSSQADFESEVEADADAEQSAALSTSSPTPSQPVQSMTADPAQDPNELLSDAPEDVDGETEDEQKDHDWVQELLEGMAELRQSAVTSRNETNRIVRNAASQHSIEANQLKEAVLSFQSSVTSLVDENAHLRATITSMAQDTESVRRQERERAQRQLDQVLDVFFAHVDQAVQHAQEAYFNA